MKASIASPLLVLVLCVSLAQAQRDPTAREWNKPTEPFRIIGNVYYVGSEGISVFLITSDEGHILIDGGFEETAPQVIANIKKLGFDIAHVRIILSSHSHYDHAGGLAELKRSSGAKLLASISEKTMLERGGKDDFHYGDEIPFEAVKVDRILRDGAVVRLGGNSITATLTPGHTKGATTFMMRVKEGGHSYSVVFASSISAPDYRLRNNPKYPAIAQDFERSFKRLEALPCDVFLTFHTAFFDLSAKREKIGKTEQNPFVDKTGLRAFVDKARRQFRDQLASEK